MKRMLILSLLLAMAGSASAATLGNWGSGGAGLWSDGTKWGGSVPALPAGTSDEVKIQAANADVTIDGTQLSDYNCRITTGGADGVGVIIRIVNGADFGMGEARIGAKKSSTVGGITNAYQTGGTLTVTDMVLGRGAGSSSVDNVVANGFYTISGGTLTYRSGGTGRLYVGAGNNTATGSDIANLTGTFTVDGALGSISMKKLYVGSDVSTTPRYGTGTVEFKVGEGGVSKIQIADAGGILLDGGDGTGIANLVVSMLGDNPAGDILLIENTSTGAYGTGAFDSLNGGSGAEGTIVAIGGASYQLTYAYVGSGDAVANDIALVIVPEPATLALLGIGGLLLRRRLA